MEIIQKIKLGFRNGNMINRLIYINVGVFFICHIIALLLKLFNLPYESVYSFVALPAYLPSIITQPWSIISYMFLHESIWHIFFNMFTLYWFGKLFLMFFSEKQMLGLYIIGGFFGAAFYIVSYNIFPFFQPNLVGSTLMGASASIMAIIVAAAMHSPNLEMRMMLIGNVKLKYIAIFFVLMSYFSIMSSNAGGEIAHLGGALSGYIFIVSLRNGRDFTKWINLVLDSIYNLFKPRKLKVKINKNQSKSKMSDAEFNMNKARNMQEIDRILDKIKTSGYESLTAEDKKRLFDQKK
jgi:membrane associated rhomboid family serine protease